MAHYPFQEKNTAEASDRTAEFRQSIINTDCAATFMNNKKWNLQHNCLSHFAETRLSYWKRLGLYTTFVMCVSFHFLSVGLFVLFQEKATAEAKAKAKAKEAAEKKAAKDQHLYTKRENETFV